MLKSPFKFLLALVLSASLGSPARAGLIEDHVVSHFCSNPGTLGGIGYCLAGVGGTYTLLLAGQQLVKTTAEGGAKAVVESTVQWWNSTPLLWSHLKWVDPSQEGSMADLTFNPSLHNQLKAYVNDLETGILYNKGIPNALFFGPKGVGKSQFMSRLSRRMHKSVLGAQGKDVKVAILPLAGMIDSDIVKQQAGGVAGLFKHLFDYLDQKAKSEPNSVYIIVIDECEKFFEFKAAQDPKSGKPVRLEDSYQWISVFIEKLGSRATNYGFVLATNTFPHRFDESFLTRMDYQIEFQLPDFFSRKTLLRKYFGDKVQALKNSGHTVHVESDFLSEPNEKTIERHSQAKAKQEFLASVKENGSWDQLITYNEQLRDIDPLMTRDSLAKVYGKNAPQQAVTLESCLKESEYSNYTDNVSFLDALSLRTACLSGREIQQFVNSVYVSPKFEGQGLNAKPLPKEKILYLDTIVSTLKLKIPQIRRLSESLLMIEMNAAINAKQSAPEASK